MTKKTYSHDHTSSPRNKDKKQIQFTRIATRTLRDGSLGAHEKVIYLLICSFNPSFPSYEKLMEYSGLSRDKVWKCIKELERRTLISWIRKGRKNVYRTGWNGPPDGLIKPKPVRGTDDTSPSGGLQPVRGTDSNYINESDQRIREETKTQNPLLNEAIENRDLKTVVGIAFGGLNKSGSDECPF